MNRIIKAGVGQTQVRPITRPVSFVPPSSQDEALERLGAKIAELRADLHARDHRILDLESEVERVAAEEYRNGEAAGLTAAETKESDRIACLAKAVEAAQQDLSEQLKATERTAILVARVCLDKMFGDKAHWTALVSDLVRHQIAQITRDTLLKVEVAAEDFTDDESLAGLDRTVDFSREDLPPGSCRMILRLGEVDAGLAQQWGMLERHLRGLAERETSHAG